MSHLNEDFSHHPGGIFMIFQQQDAKVPAILRGRLRGAVGRKSSGCFFESGKADGE